MYWIANDGDKMDSEMKSYKLKHYHIKGVFIEPGRYIDRHGNLIEFTPDDTYYINDVVPIYYTHDGPIVGFVTRIYKNSDKLCFDGYVFDPSLMNKLLSEHPGVSVELIKTDDGYLITGIALTPFPAIDNAQLCEVIALSSIRDKLTEFLKDNNVEDAEKVAALVEKFLVQFKYPCPETVEAVNEKLEEAAETINELSKQNETLEKENQALKNEIETIVKEMTAELETLKEIRRKVITDIKDVRDDIIAELKKARQELLDEIKKFKDSLIELEKTNVDKNAKNLEKLEFSVNQTNTNLDAWDAAIKLYSK